MKLGGIRIVLVRPRFAENVGAAARAMKNFGLQDWSWVAPSTLDDAAARRMAVHAEELLGRATVVDTLDEAVADCVWVVGTSSRKVPGKRRLSARDAAAELVQRSQQEGPCALVFGDERSGLTNAELRRCHDFSAIPTEDEQPSLNLAQAVMVYCYDIHQARLALEERPSPPAPRAATDAMLEQLETTLRHTLQIRGFLAGGERHAVQDLFATLRRSRLSAQEARLWMAALQVVAKGRNI